MAIKMMDFKDAFPKKVNIDQYKAVIDGALNAAIGADGVPRVMVETFDTSALATRAANAIRKHSKENHLDLGISCPEGKQCIYVYKASPRKRNKKDATARSTAEPSSPGKN